MRRRGRVGTRFCRGSECGKPIRCRNRMPAGRPGGLNSAIKVCEVLSYIEEHNIEKIPLYEQGYHSIGCEPCTSPPTNPEDPRSGRWSGKNWNAASTPPRGRINDKQVLIGFVIALIPDSPASGAEPYLTVMRQRSRFSAVNHCRFASSLGISRPGRGR